MTENQNPYGAPGQDQGSDQGQAYQPQYDQQGQQPYEAQPQQYDQGQPYQYDPQAQPYQSQYDQQGQQPYEAQPQQYDQGQTYQYDPQAQPYDPQYQPQYDPQAQQPYDPQAQRYDQGQPYQYDPQAQPYQPQYDQQGQPYQYGQQPYQPPAPAPYYGGAAAPISWWKTATGPTIGGIAISVAITVIVQVMAQTAIENYSYFNPDLTLLWVAVIIEIAFAVCSIIYAAVVYTSYFSPTPKLQNATTVSLLNGLFGGVIFGCIWNSNLTNNKKGISYIVFIVLEGIFIASEIGTLIQIFA